MKPVDNLLLLLFEGLLQQLLSLKWTDPPLVVALAHYLQAIGPFLKYYPDAVGSVINKLFELLTSLPFVVKVLYLLGLFLVIITCENCSRSI